MKCQHCGADTAVKFWKGLPVCRKCWIWLKWLMKGGVNG